MVGNAVPRQADQVKVLTGLAGREILASRSPWLHEHEAAAQGLDLAYTLFDFSARDWDDARLPDLLKEVEALGYAGLNITYPFKQAIMPLLDELSDGASQVGAVNTVALLGGRRIGYNTDVTGFAESVQSGLAGAARDRVVQAGAGGAGSATAHALLKEGVGQLTIFDTETTRLAGLVEKLQSAFGDARVLVGEDMVEAMEQADGFVNATPMGMAKQPGSSVKLELIEARHWVADIVYFPLETALLRDARKKGCRTLDGSGMATNQAASAFEIFTGLTANRTRMNESFAEFIAAG